MAKQPGLRETGSHNDLTARCLYKQLYRNIGNDEGNEIHEADEGQEGHEADEGHKGQVSVAAVLLRMSRLCCLSPEK